MYISANNEVKKQYAKAFGVPAGASCDITVVEWETALNEVRCQHPEENSIEHTARATARLLFKHCVKLTPAPIPADSKAIEEVEDKQFKLVRESLFVLTTATIRFQKTFKIYTLLTLAFWLLFLFLFFVSRANAQIDVIEVEDSAEATLGFYAAPFTFKCGANTTCTFDTTRLTLVSTVPNPTASTIGGVRSITCAGTDKLSAIGTDGIPVCSADQAGGGAAHDLLSATHSDTVAASPVLGDIVIGNVTPAWARLAGNTTATKNFLTQTGNGAISAAPTWGTIVDGDVPDNITITLASTATALAADPTDCAAGALANAIAASGNLTCTAQNAGTDITADLEEETHASEHQNGGADEVATATPAANAIPKAGAGGTIDDGWLSTTVTKLGTSIGAAEVDADVATQAEIDLKAPLASPTFTGTVTIPTPFTLGAVSVTPTGTELNFVDGVTSSIQTQIDTHAALTAAHGATGAVMGTTNTQSPTNKTVDGGVATTTHAAGANFLQTLRHATDCTAITDGKDGEICWEQDANTFFVCEPTAGGCDTGPEWVQYTVAGDGVGYDQIQEDAVNLTKRGTVNVVGVDATCVDNAGSSRTDCTIIPVAEAYDATGWDADTGAASKDNVRDKLEAMPQLAGTGLTLTGTTIDCDAASTTVVGCPELAIASEINTGTDATRAVTPDALAGSNFGVRLVQMVAVDFGTDTSVGDGKFYFVVPAELNGMNLVNVRAQVITAGTTNATNVDLARCATAATGNACSGTVGDMLSTNITIDTGENSTDTAATAAVIDGTVDDVATGQIIRVDIDAVSTTAAKGLIVSLGFQLP